MAVFFYDLLRTTRRGRLALLRSAYALILLVALYSLYAQWFPRGGPGAEKAPPSDLAKFAEEFFGRFLLIQTCAVVLLTPAFTAGAIAEERQRGTLDCLLTTHLTPMSIVSGKYVARLTHLFGILLTGLPVLALLPLWGGVDPGKVLVAFGSTATTVASLGALGLWCSATARTVRGAVTGTYALTAVGAFCPLCVCFNPFGPLLSLMSFDPIANLTGFASLGGVVSCQVPLTIALLLAAERDLRLSSRPSRTPAANALRITPAFSSPEPRSYARAVTWRPRIGDRALLWKELHIGGSEWAHILMPLLIAFVTLAVGICLMIALVGVHTVQDDVCEVLNLFVRVFAVSLLGLVALGTLFRATASVGREREQKTLDMLLTLPNGRHGLLEMKCLGSILAGRWLLLGLLVVLVLGVLGGGVHPIAVPLLAITAGIHLVFIASLGILLSVVVPHTGRAGLIGLVIVFAMSVAPLFYGPFDYSGPILPVAWIACLPRTFGVHNLLEQQRFVWSLTVSLVMYAAVAVLLWYVALSRFHGEGEQDGIVG
jgi:ABC-type transport system involved in multi-copper enzyme maturation permease subunit